MVPNKLNFGQVAVLLICALVITLSQSAWLMLGAGVIAFLVITDAFRRGQIK